MENVSDSGAVRSSPVTSGVTGSGAAIKRARTAAGLSVRALAAHMDLSPATISAIENGRTEVTVARLRRFATVLEVPTAHLLAEGGAPVDAVAPAAEPEHAADLPDWRDFPPLTLDPVLAATVAAIVETGYHGTTMRSVAARAGLSVPGIYHHYTDKQQLLVRILDLTMDELHLRVSAAADSAADSVERVARVVEALALFHTHRRALAFIGASEMRSLTAANRTRIADSRSRLQRVLDHAIEAAAAEGRLCCSDPHTAGRAIATMCTSIPQWFRDDGPLTPEDVARDYAGFALALLGVGHRG
ncbi:TetR family transcriptional regulator [Nocardia bovistercoris]|uniref:TetR family transcriptional regulator n=1 Tax=Nocardia bovistercoris TaxID=2785916 RepID=UPI002FCD57C1